MKHTNPFLITCLSLCMAVSLSAQQGNVASGGEASGFGGSLSYSVGQTDYKMYSSAFGSLSLGIQQSWFTVPLIYQVPASIITDGDISCFNASEYLLIGGTGNEFIVEPYGHADLIAGKSIILKPGTQVLLHGGLHARISTDWCSPQQTLLASSDDEPQPIMPIIEPRQKSDFFKVYPNPTTGNFTLELLNVEEASLLLVEIYTMQGHLLFSNELKAEQSQTLSLSGRQPGIYVIKVLQNKNIGISKVIKQ